MTGGQNTDLTDALRAGAIGKHDDLSVMDEAVDLIKQLMAENARLRCVMTKAHAVMRQTGWQLALSCEDPPGGDLLALAAAEVESEFASVLGAKEGDE